MNAWEVDCAFAAPGFWKARPPPLAHESFTDVRYLPALTIAEALPFGFSAFTAASAKPVELESEGDPMNQGHPPSLFCCLANQAAAEPALAVCFTADKAVSASAVELVSGPV